MSKKTFKLYRVNWVDAASNSGWVHISDIKTPKDYLVSTVGWLIYEDKNYYVLAQNLTSSGNVSDRMQIPKKWVTKVSKLAGNIIEYRG